MREERKLPAMLEMRKRVRMSLSIVVIGMKCFLCVCYLLLIYYRDSKPLLFIGTKGVDQVNGTAKQTQHGMEMGFFFIMS